MPFSDSLVATTEGTHALTEWEMNVQTDTLVLILIVDFGHCRFPEFPRKTLQVPIGYSGITGIPWSWHIIFLNQIAHKLYFIELK